MGKRGKKGGKGEGKGGRKLYAPLSLKRKHDEVPLYHGMLPAQQTPLPLERGVSRARLTEPCP